MTQEVYKESTISIAEADFSLFLVVAEAAIREWRSV